MRTRFLLPFMISALFMVPIYTTSTRDHGIQQLSLDQKIGTLFMAAVVADPTNNRAFMDSQPYTMDPLSVQTLVEQYHIGSIIFLGVSSIEKQQQVTAQLNAASTRPLFIGQDLEWGLGMRLSDGMTFPHAMALGALTEANEHLIYELGYTIGL